MASWDVDEAQGCSGWIVWQILGRHNLTLPELLKYSIFYNNHRRNYLYPIISFKRFELEAHGWSHIASNWILYPRDTCIFIFFYIWTVHVWDIALHRYSFKVSSSKTTTTLKIMIFSKFCFANILPIVFLSSPMHAETGFEGLQNGFFGFSFGGYRRGVYQLQFSTNLQPYTHISPF